MIVATELKRTGWPVQLELGALRRAAITAAELPGQIGVQRVEVAP
jgi:hypothetical protein